jgi:20S proteasome subunit beta 3
MGTETSERRPTWASLFQMVDSYNGSALLAMAGDHCVAIAADRRFGVQMETVSTTCEKIFQINDRIFLGLGGLLTDVQTVYEQLRYDVSLLELHEERPIEPEVLSHWSNPCYTSIALGRISSNR